MNRRLLSFSKNYKLKTYLFNILQTDAELINVKQ